jgi:hypothetical protein
MQTRTCTGPCGLTKDISEFYKNGKHGNRRSRCKDCIKPAFNADKKARDKRHRLEALSHYSEGGQPRCACRGCFESHVEFLTIDHIHGGGNKHRKEVVTGSGSFVRWLRRNSYPDGYRVLCYNCNTARGLHGYCPHEQSPT